MPDHDADVAGADGACRLHEVHLADRQRLAAHQTGEARHVDDGQRQDGVHQARPEHGDDAERQDEHRERQQRIHEAHDDVVGAPARIARHEANDAADDERQDDRDEDHLERDLRPVNQAREDVAADLVGAQGMCPGRRCDHRLVVDLGRVMGCEHRRQRGAEDDDEDDHEAGHADLVTQQLAQHHEIAVLGAFGGGEARGDGVDHARIPRA
ncbi:MAG: hypothetical protein R3D25_10295 [Geminicoccaceae bacterium]